MAEDETKPSGPDLTQGIALAELVDGGKLVGHVGDEQVLLVRRGTEVFAIGALCTHYHGPLVDGLVVDDTVRCPWHHACFDLRTGEALRAPALSPIACWFVEQSDGKVFVREKQARSKRKPAATAPRGGPEKIVIVGGGAAGFAAAERLRREQYQGSIVMLSNDAAAPVDRPNLSKDYLAGKAPEDWVPLRSDSFYSKNGIDLRLQTNVIGIDIRSREVTLDDGSRVAYDRLLLATGAEPVRLSIPGADQPNVLTLRSLADCRAIIEQAGTARRAVVMGASFIGLEVAAALRARDIEVHVVAPDRLPMERILGPEMGEFVRSLHESHGVVFHLEDTATAIEGKQVKLKIRRNARRPISSLPASAYDRGPVSPRGLGSRPIAVLSSTAILKQVRRGCLPPATLRAGPIRAAVRKFASNIGWLPSVKGRPRPSTCSGTARNSLPSPSSGASHYDLRINYVGHAEEWDEIGDRGRNRFQELLAATSNAGAVARGRHYRPRRRKPRG